MSKFKYYVVIDDDGYARLVCGTYTSAESRCMEWTEHMGLDPDEWDCYYRVELVEQEFAVDGMSYD